MKEQRDPWNRIENAETDPQKYSQLIFDEVAKMVFPTNGTEAAGHTHAKNESSCRLRPFIKVNSNWVTDLNVNIKL